MSKRSFAAVALLVFSAVLLAQTAGHNSSLAQQFRIDPHRPYVYLKFDHLGSGIPFTDDEPTTRVWLRFVNNCRVPIRVRTFGVPGGSPKDEVGLMYDIVQHPEPFGIIHGAVVPEPLGVIPGVVVAEPSASELAPILNPEQTSVQPVKATNTNASSGPQVPHGYDFDVSSLETLAPGESLLFSVPITHLSKQWHMEIGYNFALPSPGGYRQHDVGGEPRMVLLYSAFDLPNQTQGQIEKLTNAAQKR